MFSVGCYKEVIIKGVILTFCSLSLEESFCCTRTLEGGCIVCRVHLCQTAQPVFMMQVFITIEMGDFTIERCHYLLCGEWQTDTFPGSGSILSIVHRLANIPGMVGYREFDWHAEVVVLTLVSLAVLTLRGAFYEVEERGGIAIGIILENMMSVDGSLTRVLLVAECIVCDVVSLCIVFDVVGSSIYQEVLAYSLLDA